MRDLGNLSTWFDNFRLAVAGGLNKAWASDSSHSKHETGNIPVPAIFIKGIYNCITVEWEVQAVAVKAAICCCCSLA